MTVKARIYQNDGAGGPVDYTTPVAEVAASLGTYTPAAALPLSSDTTFALRFYDDATLLEERNTAAAARVVVDASGNDATAVPPAPAGVGASALPGGGARVRWVFSPAPGAPEPTGFHVYAGTPTVSFASPAATVLWYRQRTRYATGPDEPLAGHDLSGLTDGAAYQVVVRSYNAAGESADSETAAFTAKSTPPAAADAVAATAVP